MEKIGSNYIKDDTTKSQFVDYCFGLLCEVDEQLTESSELARANKRYIEEDVGRIVVMLRHKKDAELTPDYIKGIFKLTKKSFFRDIFLDEYANFTQKENFGGEEQLNYDKKQQDIHTDLEFLSEHMDEALIMYYSEIDKGFLPIQSINTTVELLRQPIEKTVQK